MSPKPHAVLDGAVSEVTDLEHVTDSWCNDEMKGAGVEGGWLLGQPTDWIHTTLILVD